MAIDPPRTLLVLKPSSFGDIVHTLPAVARLRVAWPECRISWLANTEWTPLLDGNPVIDEVISFPRSEFRGLGGVWRMWKWIREVIRGRQPDLALDFQGLLRTAVIGQASGAKNFWGLDDAREGAGLLFDRRIKMPPQPVHAVERYLALANAAIALTGQSGASLEALKWTLPTGRAIEHTGLSGEPYVLLHPFARGIGKSLSGQQIQQLIRSLHNCKIALIGRYERGEEGDFDGCINLMNCTSISELIWLTRNASFVISVDSGPAHLAAALGRPMVALHSWSDPRKVGPYQPHAWIWKHGTLTRVANLNSMPTEFFAPSRLDLKPTDVDLIAALATSPSGSCA